MPFRAGEQSGDGPSGPQQAPSPPNRAAMLRLPQPAGLHNGLKVAALDLQSGSEPNGDRPSFTTPIAVRRACKLSQPSLDTQGIGCQVTKPRLRRRTATGVTQHPSPFCCDTLNERLIVQPAYVPAQWPRSASRCTPAATAATICGPRPRLPHPIGLLDFGIRHIFHPRTLHKNCPSFKPL